MPEEFAKRLAHPCFPQPDSTDRTVWRYMTLAKLVSMLQTGTLYLSRLDLLNDPHEGSLPRQLVDARNNFFEAKGLSHILSQVQTLGRKVRAASDVSCWALSEFESEALWRLYSRQGDGVAIRSTYQALVDLIEKDDELYVGCIRYLDYETEWFPEGNLYYPVMHKRRAFAHEQEVRIVKLLHAHVGLDSPVGPPGVTAPTDLGALIQGLHISPYAQEWYASVVTATVEKFAPFLVSRIRWSPMKAAPLY